MSMLGGDALRVKLYSMDGTINVVNAHYASIDRPGIGNEAVWK